MARTAEWFASLTKKAQREYLAKHPNSKYGKKAAPKTAAKEAVKKSVIKPITGKSPQETKLKQKVAGLRLSLQGFSKTSPGYAKRKKDYDKAVADLKALKVKAGTAKVVKKPAAAAKAHEAKRAADKNRIVARVPSKGSKAKTIFGSPAKQTLAARRAEVKSDVELYTRKLKEAKAANSKARTQASISKWHREVQKFTRLLKGAKARLSKIK